MEGFSYEGNKNFFFFFFLPFSRGEEKHKAAKWKMRLITRKNEREGEKVGRVDKMREGLQSGD